MFYAREKGDNKGEKTKVRIEKRECKWNLSDSVNGMSMIFRPITTNISEDLGPLPLW